MGRLIVLILIVGAIWYAWQKGLITQWFNTAVDSGVESAKRTQREATTVRPVDAPEDKK